jgi:hypothetical protein
MLPAVSRAYLSRKLTRPLATKDGGTLRTVLDARAYMFRLSKDRERSAGGKGRPNYSLRRPMSALSAGNSNSRWSMTASSTLRNDGAATQTGLGQAAAEDAARLS